MRLVTLVSAVALLAAIAPAMAQSPASADEIYMRLTGGGAPAARAAPVEQTGTVRVPGWKFRGIKPAPTPTHSVSLQILFATSSAELTPAGRAYLDQLGEALKRKPLNSTHFRIEGHTDTAGDARTNLVLSDRRAKAVVSYLATHFGLDSGNFSPVGMGKEGLAKPTPDQTPEPANRRVVVINLDS